MAKKVAILHTSMVFLERERLLFELFDELLPDVEKVNIVEDTMLKQVTSQNSITPDVVRRMCYYVLAAEATGANAVFSTCSSLGPAIDVARQIASIPVLKIDDALAEEAVRVGKRIAVLATVPTTLRPTSDLLLAKSKLTGASVETREQLCEGAFGLLMAGETAKHDDLVLAKAREVDGWADTVVLAQCSMARLAPRLAEATGLPVLSSPRLGLQHLRRVLDSS